MLHDVVGVRHLGGYRLRVRFDNGVEGDVDLTHRLEFDGVFAPLKDPAYLAQVKLERDGGTNCWPNEANVDQVVLYSWVTGKPVPDFDADIEGE